MKIEILKRIEAAERFVSKTDIPDLITIDYDWVRGKWKVVEAFMKKDAKGNASGGCTNKCFYMDHYKNYIVQPDFNGTILLDLIDCPPEFEGNLNSFTGAQIRKGVAAGCGVSFEYAGESEEKNISCFNVSVYKP